MFCNKVPSVHALCMHTQSCQCLGSSAPQCVSKPLENAELHRCSRAGACVQVRVHACMHANCACCCTAGSSPSSSALRGKLHGQAVRAHEGAVEVLYSRLRVRHAAKAHEAELARGAIPVRIHSQPCLGCWATMHARQQLVAIGMRCCCASQGVVKPSAGRRQGLGKAMLTLCARPWRP